MPSTRSGRSSSPRERGRLSLSPRGRRGSIKHDPHETDTVIMDNLQQPEEEEVHDEGIERSDAYQLKVRFRFSPVIDKVIYLCGFPEDSTMVKFIHQEGWDQLNHITTIDIDEVKEFCTLKASGAYEAHPMKHHLRLFKVFLMYYKRKCIDLSTTLTEDDVMDMTKRHFEDYSGSPEFDRDMKSFSAPALATVAARVDPNINGIIRGNGQFTAEEFRRSVRRDKSHYTDLKDDKFFSSWNRGFVATAHMHHTNMVLDANYIPADAMEAGVFREIQTFMYAVLEEHLHTDKGKSLVSQYEVTRDAQSVYRELQKHALNSTAAQLSGDTLLQYITSARFPGNWRGTAYGFTLHWKEQVMKYEKLELEPFPPKQKLRMLQNAVGDVTELAYVKQIGDQNIAAGGIALDYNAYMELLLSACSSYDKKITLPGKQKRAVYSSEYIQEEGQTFHGQDPQEEFSMFKVDTDVSEVMVNYTNTNQGYRRPFNKSNNNSNFLPREEWNKLTQEQKDALISKRREENNKNKPTQGLRQANVHEFEDVVNLDDIISYLSMNHNVQSQGMNTKDTDDGNTLLAHMAGQGFDTSPGDIRHVLATNRKPITPKSRKVNEGATAPASVKVGDTMYYLDRGESITFKDHQYFAHTAVIQYRVSQLDVTVSDRMLIDRGANGGICGEDMLVVEDSERKVDVFGLAGHKVSQLQIVTAQAVFSTHKGNVVGTFHQMALLGKGKSILSCLQMESYGATIEDRPRTIQGGKQRILHDGYQIPLDFKNGLAYLRCRKPTPHDLSSLPHVIMTADIDWDPSKYDNSFDSIEDWFDPNLEFIDHNDPFDAYGDHRHRVVAKHLVIEEEDFFDSVEFESLHDQIDDLFDELNPGDIQSIFVASLQTVNHKPNFENLRPLFGWAPADTIQRTFDVTTQFARGRISDTLKQHWKSRFPACNVQRRNEPVATDTVFSDTPAVDSGVTAAQIFVGRESLVVDVYGLKTDKEFVNTLEDNIRERGAMNKLISDCAKAENSHRVQNILRALCISSWFSEPYYQNQNFAENRYNTLKAATNRVMNLSGSPASTWLLALQYVALLLNHLASAALGWKPPLQLLQGQTPDISKFLYFSFYEPVYYQSYSNSFPSDSNEEQGWWIGVATHVGDALTYKILTQKHRVIFRSAIRSALDPAKRNLRLSPIRGEIESNSSNNNIFVRSRDKPEILTDMEPLEDNDQIVKRRMVTIDPKDLIGRTFLKDTDDDGQRFRSRVVQAIVEKENDMKMRPEYVRFVCEVPEEKVNDVLTYNEVLDRIDKDSNEIMNDTEQLYMFRKISAHQGPLKSTDKDYKGSTYNVLVEWESGESTYEPLDIIGKDDPVTCAEYAMKNSLLDTHGWKRFRTYANAPAQHERVINQAKQQAHQREPFWKFGVLVPRSHRQAVDIDNKNGNKLWQESEATEMQQLLEYKTFIDHGKGIQAPMSYKKIRCHMIYDVKHDGRHKARLVAGGHLTDPNTESVYSGVVTLRGIRLVVFLAELNGLQLWGADVGNAYLEAITKEKVYIVGGPEFGKLEGHTLSIFKALYGLRSSGLCWYQRFSDVLRAIGFIQSKAEPEIWMREKNKVYEYIAVYVDDLLIAACDPGEITTQLIENHKFKLKGVGPLTYHLGCNYYRDALDGTLSYGPKKYIDKLVDQYKAMYGISPKEYTSPLEKGDHPEIDLSEELDNEGIKKYQTMIGCLQWAVSLGRFDIQTATMTMSRFRVAPRMGHLDRLKRMYGYLKKFSSAAIRVRTMQPNFKDLPEQNFDWCHTVYGSVEELIPKDAPKPLGREVVTVTYTDANLYHDMLTGRSVTGILHLCNQTLIEWYSKRQATVETATFGSEFTAARIAVDQIIDLRITLRYLGVPVAKRSFMFGDNQSVITNSTIPHSSLNKRHNALAYHRVREMIAAEILAYYWIDGDSNPADVVSKHWGYQQVWKLLKPLLFYSGNTGDLIQSVKEE